MERVALKSTAGRWIIVAMALGSGMIFLDGSVVNVALPRIQTELGAPLSGLQWIVNGYTLFLGALVLLGGSVGDVYGRKGAFLIGLVLFTLASVACGLAPNLSVLIAARIVQGIGGALLVPGSLATIKAVMSPEDSGAAIGLWAGLSGVTAAAGPLVGGYLVDAVSWRAIFFINVPFALLTAYAAIRHVPANRDPNASHHLDWPGVVATIMGLGGLTYALIEGPASGWGDPTVIIGIVIGVLGIALFPIREARARNPMVPMHTWTSRNFTGSNLATIGVYFSLSGVLFFLVLDLQQVQGYSPLQAGVSLIPVTLILLFLSPRVGSLMNRVGARIPMTVAPLVVAAGFLLLMTGGRSLSYPRDLLPGICVIGLGMSFFVTPLTATVMSSVPEGLAGVASGVSNTVTRVASLLAIAVLGVVAVNRFDSALRSHVAHLPVPITARAALIAHDDRLAGDPIPPGLTAPQQLAARTAVQDAFVDAFRWDMATCAILCVSSAVFSFWLIRDPRRSDASVLEPATAGA